jgi:hypothetical protein
MPEGQKLLLVTEDRDYQQDGQKMTISKPAQDSEVSYEC